MMLKSFFNAYRDKHPEAEDMKEDDKVEEESKEPYPITKKLQAMFKNMIEQDKINI